MHPSKRKGDKAEREVERMLQDQLGVPARRALGAGRADDIGDITGVPNTTIQVANWGNVALAVRKKPLEAEEQRARAGTPFACTFLRLLGNEPRRQAVRGDERIRTAVPSGTNDPVYEELAHWTHRMLQALDAYWLHYDGYHGKGHPLSESTGEDWWIRFEKYRKRVESVIGAGWRREPR